MLKKLQLVPKVCIRQTQAAFTAKRANIRTFRPAMPRLRHASNELPVAPLSRNEYSNVQQFVLDGLKTLEAASEQHEDLSGGSTYTGLNGVALTYWLLSHVLRMGDTDLQSSILSQHPAMSDLRPITTSCSQAMAWQGAWRLNTAALKCRWGGGRVTFLEGVSGPLALRAVLAHESGDITEMTRCLQELVNMCRQQVLVMPAGECEVLYGRCGFLYSLLFVCKHCSIRVVSGLVPNTLIEELVDQVVAAGEAGAVEAGVSASWGLMYSWHGSFYLGGAHGVSGILQTLLLAEAYLSVAAANSAAPGVRRLRLVHQAACALVQSCFPSGNLPSSLEKEDDRLVQWCHGAPGLVPLLLQCHDQWGSSQDGGPADFLAAAQRAANTVWQRGLLLKGVGLCHGIGGNGYTFLSMYRATGDEKYLYQAQQFAAFSANNWRPLYAAPDRPASMFEGLAGGVCFALHSLSPAHSVFPGYEL